MSVTKFAQEYHEKMFPGYKCFDVVKAVVFLSRKVSDDIFSIVLNQIIVSAITHTSSPALTSNRQIRAAKDNVSILHQYRLIGSIPNRD